MKNSRKSLLMFAAIASMVLSSSCSGQPANSEEKSNADGKKYKVTFVELGSVRCIPCQQMQPVMKSIEEKYWKDVKVVFHDVWTEAGSPYAKQYGIEAIPTQVFLDENGKEFYRHVGFFPEEELVKILNQKGIK